MIGAATNDLNKDCCYNFVLQRVVKKKKDILFFFMILILFFSKNLRFIIVHHQYLINYWSDHLSLMHQYNFQLKIAAAAAARLACPALVNLIV